MTVPDVGLAFDRWSGRIIAFCSIGTCISLIGFAVLQVQLRGKANRGDIARDVQLAKQPAGCKIAQDAYRRGVISRRELAPYYAAPHPCPMP